MLRKHAASLQDQEAESISEELEFDDVEKEELSEASIVKKYDEGQARIIIQRNDFLIPNILQMVEKRDVLNLSPKYQRRIRWTDIKRSHLIESLLINIPIPPIFLYERDLAKYEVMDGQQRLDTIRAFFKNEFALKELKKWNELNGKCYEDLPDRIQRGLARRGLAAVIVLTESGQNEKAALEIRQYVFERLNTGGEKLNAQEVRNCIYASPFNDILIKIARSPEFTTVWGVPPKEPKEPYRVSDQLKNNSLYSKMDDCQIVLRFFALSDMSHFEKGMKDALDECMRRSREFSIAACSKLKSEYMQKLKIAIQIYGEKLFRLPNRKGELAGRRSVPLADAVLLGIKNSGTKGALLPKHSDYIVRQTKKLLSAPKTYETLVGRGNTRAAVEKRISLLTRVFHRALKE
jgi:Protein of unknown function DUF262